MNRLPIQLPSPWTLLVCFAAIAVFAGSTQAKLAQYASKDSGTQYLAKAVKMRDSAVYAAHWVGFEAGPAAIFCEPPARRGLMSATVVFAPRQVVPLPFDSRPPPSATC